MYSNAWLMSKKQTRANRHLLLMALIYNCVVSWFTQTSSLCPIVFVKTAPEVVGHAWREHRTASRKRTTCSLYSVKKSPSYLESIFFSIKIQKTKTMLSLCPSSWSSGTCGRDFLWKSWAVSWLYLYFCFRSQVPLVTPCLVQPKMKWASLFHQNKIFFVHFSCQSLKNDEQSAKIDIQKLLKLGQKQR